MNLIAETALRKLLAIVERAEAKNAGSWQDCFSIKFSKSSVPSYVDAQLVSDKNDCHQALLALEKLGIIGITWDRRAGVQNNVSSVTVKDSLRLAKRLDVIPRWIVVDKARTAFLPKIDEYPVLRNVLVGWGNGKRIRETTPSQYGEWLEAIRVVEYCRDNVMADVAVRRTSVKLTADSKRLEKLCPLIDVIIQGDVVNLTRDPIEILNEIGLVKFPPTVLISGCIDIVLEGQIEPLTNKFPYLGFAPSAILSFKLPSTLGLQLKLLTVENLTTFNELAATNAESRRCLVLYTGGMPSPSLLRVYNLMLVALPTTTEIFHWGDIDGGGFRIAAHIAKTAHLHGRKLNLHCMHDVVPTATRHIMDDSEVKSISRICEKFEWQNTSQWVSKNRLAIEQESIDLCWPD